MQFLVLAYDSSDENAPDRRMAARPAHLALGDTMRAEGKHLYATAILGDEDAMIGSMVVCQFDTREELDQWLEAEPYVTGDVWEHIMVQPCKVGPSYAK